VLLSEISVANDLLCSVAFLTKFKETLNNLAENDPLLIERLRLQSGTQQKSSKDYADKLVTMAQLYRSPDENQLGEAIQKFSTVITSPQCKRSERFAASDAVRRAIAFFESTQSSIENDFFKQEDKKLIKETQRALGLRK
jgi:hypothetical protein